MRVIPRILALGMLVSVAAACSDAGLLEPDMPSASHQPGEPPELGHLEICKTGVGSGVFTIIGSGQVSSATPEDIDITVPLSAGDCEIVLTVHIEPGANTSASVVVTETPVTGYQVAGVTTEFYNLSDPVVEAAGSNPQSVTIADDSGWVITFENEPEIVALDGRMTGGGSVFDSNDRRSTRFTHGFELHCDADDPRQNLEINWNGNRFHLLDLTSGLCIDDPAIDHLPRRAGIDTFIGEGTGRYNGVPGASIEFVLTDAGEPGRRDTARWTIRAEDGTVVADDIFGNLTRGNHQAHTNN